MAATDTQQARIHAFLGERFRGMGLSVRALADECAWLVALPIGPAPFTGIGDPWSAERLLFSTIDAGRIKCLRPNPLFGLPILDVRDADTPAEIEAIVRSAWRTRVDALREAHHWLANRGTEAEAVPGTSHLAVALDGETSNGRLRLNDRTQAILPSCGPLSGLALERAEDRVVPLDRRIESAADLDLHVSACLDALARAAQKREHADRKERLLATAEPVRTAPRPLDPAEEKPASPERHHPRLLLVGPRLVDHAGLREALGRGAFRVATARDESEALTRLAQATPDVVVSEYGLGRSDGASLIQAARAVAGIEGIPVVLVDSAANPGRRDVARAVGARGYVVGPENPRRFVARLQRLVEAPGGRRFTRYSGRFDARLRELSGPCLVTQVGRGGAFVATDLPIALHAPLSGEILLPELSRPLGFKGDVRYHAEYQGALPGFGLRFHRLDAEDEAALIDLLARLDHDRP